MAIRKGSPPTQGWAQAGTRPVKIMVAWDKEMTVMLVIVVFSGLPGRLATLLSLPFLKLAAIFSNPSEY